MGVVSHFMAISIICTLLATTTSMHSRAEVGMGSRKSYVEPGTNLQT